MLSFILIIAVNVVIWGYCGHRIQAFVIIMIPVLIIRTLTRIEMKMMVIAEMATTLTIATIVILVIMTIMTVYAQHIC